LGGAVKIRCVTKIDTPHGVAIGLPPADALIRIFRMALVRPNYSQFASDEFVGGKSSKGSEKEETKIGRKQRRKDKALYRQKRKKK
jgi:hypothetical protein